MLETIFKREAAPARTASRAGWSASLHLLLRRCAGLICCVLAPLAVQAAEPAVRELDIADYRAYLSDDHPARQGMRQFAKLVAATSAGSLHITPRTDALPGSPAQQLAALQAGAPQAPALMLVAATGLAPLVPAFSLLDLPFLLRDAAQADAVLDGGFGSTLLEQLAPHGLVGLAWWENGFRQITSARGPIRRVEDLHDLNFRVIGEPVFIDTVKALGAKPLPLPFGELYAALAAGRVDAEDNFTSQILAGRLYQVQTALSITNHSYSPLLLVANGALWNSLNADQQRLLQAAALAAGKAQRRIARAQDHAALGQLAQLGMLVEPTPAPELKKMRALTAPLRAQAFARHPEALRQLYQADAGGVE